MSKKEKDTKSIKESKELVGEGSVTSIISEDKNNITEKKDDKKKENQKPREKKSKNSSSKENIKEINKEVPEEKVNNEKEDKIDKATSSEAIEQIKEEENIDNAISSPSKKSHKTLLIVSFSILAIFILFFIFSTIFALITSSQTTIIHGIKIKDIDVSGLSKEDALEKVSSAFKEKLEKQITLKHNDYSITIFPEQFNVSFEIEEAVNMAYEKGRNRKCFSKQL